MKRVALPNKYPAESLQVQFDFISQVPVGQTITGATVTAALFSGIDGAPAALISGPASFVGSVASQTIAGGIVGNIYTLLCVATTSGGLSLMQQGYLAVVPTQP